MSPCVGLMLPFLPETLGNSAMSGPVSVLYRQPGLLLAQQQLQGVAHGIDPSGALGLSLAALQDNPDLQKLFRLSEVKVVPRLRQWQEPLQELAAAPSITYGSPVELSSYKEFVRSRIVEAQSAASANWEWRDSGLLQYLDRALRLVEEDNTGLGRQKAVELLGFCTLAERFHAGGGVATSLQGKWPLSVVSKFSRSRSIGCQSCALRLFGLGVLPGRCSCVLGAPLVSAGSSGNCSQRRWV